jgi:transcriptional regulator with GAF, ATPase, and Fis domain
VHSKTLQQVALAAAESPDTTEVLSRIVHGLADEVGLALARIWLLGPGDICDECRMRPECPDQSRCLHLVASAGTPLTAAAERWTRIDGDFRRFPIGARKVGRIAGSGESIWLENVHDDYAWIGRPDWAREEKIKSFVGHPLVYRGEVLGVLAVFCREGIDQEGVEWLRAFAAQAAVAIANARAFEELGRLRAQLEQERDYLREEVRESRGSGIIIGESAAVRALLERIAVVAPTDASVLVQGESGTGKELVAQALHEASGRRDKPLVRVNCAAVPRELFESEFFGHVRGAFTGAVRDRAGRFELADRGTLFLDEVGEIPLELQGKLLRVLQEGCFERVGEEGTRRVDVRIIAATNRDLAREVEGGRFRQDLFYRLAVFPINVPPLRMRSEDVGLLAAHFLARSAQRLGRPGLRLIQGDVQRLAAYDWPGNVRELASVIERAAILARGERLAVEMVLPSADSRLPSVHAAKSSPGLPAEGAIETETSLRDRERNNLIAALERCGGRIYGPQGAAILLGVKPTTLASRLKALGISRPRR